MGMVCVAALSLLGCIILGFTLGWRLTILAVFVATPLLIGTGYYRVRYEMQFEKMNQAVFAESSKFAAEAISAFRTVNSLTLEAMICDRYDRLLQGHVTAAFNKARFSSLLFALSDSMQLPLTALTFWYGGGREYSLAHFFEARTDSA
jgi:ATP-binding cassette subfamily B (MDR/TAP) protein 1